MNPYDEIKEKIDLVSYISGFVKLTPAGRNYRGLCPFHKEKTPSFFVSPDKGLWHCFGCGEGGDLFKFVMKMENVEFGEALKILAEKAGITLKKYDYKLTSLKEKILEILKEATTFYKNELSKNESAKNYLKSRGLKEETINEFQLGFAPNSWNSLLIFLKNKGFTPSEIEAAGLIIKKENFKDNFDVEEVNQNLESGGNFSKNTSDSFSNYYDRFRNRIMFPILDSNSRIVGFSARILPKEFNGEDEDKVAKYINTPETIVYQKGRILFGFDKSKEQIRESDEALIVEGNMDMIMGWQDGIKNIVAVSGTALTSEQLELLKRFTNNLVLNFDMDSAGEIATDRSIALAIQKGFNLKIITISQVKDLADFIKNNPNSALDLLKQNRKDIMEYYFEKIDLKINDSLENKKKSISYLLSRIKLLPSTIDRQYWLEKLSFKSGIDLKLLNEELQKIPTILEATDNNDIENKISEALFVKSRYENLAEKVLGFILKNQEFLPKLKDYYQYFPNKYQETISILLNNNLKNEVNNELINNLILRAEYEIYLLDDKENKFDLEKEIDWELMELKKEYLKNKIKELTINLKEVENSNDDQKLEDLLLEIKKLTSQLALIE